MTSPGGNSLFRDRSVEESAELFARMRAGEFRNGERMLRAKIDMTSANMNLRDPVIYRIINASQAPGARATNDVTRRRAPTRHLGILWKNAST